jgi:hypothetical protein
MINYCQRLRFAALREEGIARAAAQATPEPERPNVALSSMLLMPVLTRRASSGETCLGDHNRHLLAASAGRPGTDGSSRRSPR